jgi:hypothetical protein
LHDYVEALENKEVIPSNPVQKPADQPKNTAADHAQNQRRKPAKFPHFGQMIFHRRQQNLHQRNGSERKQTARDHQRDNFIIEKSRFHNSQFDSFKDAICSPPFFRVTSAGKNWTAGIMQL